MAFLERLIRFERESLDFNEIVRLWFNGDVAHCDWPVPIRARVCCDPLDQVGSND